MIIVVIKNIGQFLPFAFSFLCNFQKHIYRILHFISLFLVVLGFYSQNLILEGPKLNYVMIKCLQFKQLFHMYTLL